MIPPERWIDIEIDAAARELKFLWEHSITSGIIITVCCGLLLTLALGGCATEITANTPCGEVKYYSTKDIKAPTVMCRVNFSGEYELTYGAESASGSAAIAGAIAEAAFKTIGLMK